MGVLEGTGCALREFCPGDVLERWVMAVWLVRVLDGADPEPSSTRFVDVDPGLWWSPYVERLAVLGVTAGCATDPARYCPDASVTRGQMAAFLSRAFGLEPASSFGFTDVGGNTHANSINSLAAAGVTVGCATSPARYCPTASVTRGQMATFLGRALSLSAELSVGVESFASLLVGDGFDVTITFSGEVEGFSESGLLVVNGEVSNLAGSGTRYEATIEPRTFGTVLVWVRPGAAHARFGVSNSVSAPLIRTRVSDPARHRPGFDTWDRATVVASYSGEFGRVDPDWGYTGDVAECVAGTTSKEFRDSVVQRVNWYRQMGGLNAVSESPALSATAQYKALIMLAEGRLSHFPTSDWACYRSVEGPGGENLGLGVAGVGGVDGYMQDTGDRNLAVGHRIQILSPLVTEIGVGNVRSSGGYRFANAMHLGYDFGLDPTVREERGFVAWPPAGYVPSGVVWGRWSFSKQRIATEVTRSGNTTYTRWFLTQPDFSDAAVSVTDDDGPVETMVIHRGTALVWAMEGDTQSAILAEPTGGDRCYKVTISGVRENDTLQVPYEYAVCVLGPND